MNIWTKKSIELANGANYLDQLSNIYPNYVNPEIAPKPEKRDEILAAHQKEATDVFKYFLNLTKQPINSDVPGTGNIKFKFPVKNSYVSFLKSENNFKDVISLNPTTIHEIGMQIKELKPDELMFRITMGAEVNRQRGADFKNWLKDQTKHGIPHFYDVPKFFAYSDGPAFFVDTDEKMQEVAKEKFSYIHNKGIDFLGKDARGNYYIGEAKWLTDSGGTQDRQFENAMATLDARFESDYNVEAIAILDGVIWSDKLKGRKSPKTIRRQQSNKIVLSALLLPDLLS